MKKLIMLIIALFIAIVAIIKADWGIYAQNNCGELRFIGIEHDYLPFGGYFIFFDDGSEPFDGRTFDPWGVPTQPCDYSGGCAIGHFFIDCYDLENPTINSDPIWLLNFINGRQANMQQQDRNIFIYSWYVYDPDGCISYIHAHANDNMEMQASAATLSAIMTLFPIGPFDVDKFVQTLSGDAKDLASHWKGMDGRSTVAAWWKMIHKSDGGCP